MARTFHKVPAEYGHDEQETIMRHDAEAMTPEAEYAFELLARWGLIAGKDGGEDTVGRYHISLASVDEAVDRAFTMSEKAFAEARKRGWTIEVPMPKIRLSRAEREAKEKAMAASDA